MSEVKAIRKSLVTVARFRVADLMLMTVKALGMR